MAHIFLAECGSLRFDPYEPTGDEVAPVEADAETVNAKYFAEELSEAGQGGEWA